VSSENGGPRQCEIDKNPSAADSNLLALTELCPKRVFITVDMILIKTLKGVGVSQTSSFPSSSPATTRAFDNSGNATQTIDGREDKSVSVGVSSFFPRRRQLRADKFWACRVLFDRLLMDWFSMRSTPGNTNFLQ
jgi:hypothetical protein